MEKNFNTSDILNPYLDAKETYKSYKNILSFKQRLLFLKYLLALKSYNDLYKSLNYSELASILVDSLLISVKEPTLAARLTNYFSAKKYAETKKIVNDEINRIYDFLNEFYNKEDKYRSTYSTEDIKQILSGENDEILSKILDFNDEYNNEYNKETISKQI